MKISHSTGEDYESAKEWDCFCQCGSSGIVFSQKGNYTTAFFEAFPKEPCCFIRGEGETIEVAEQDAWNQYQKIKGCKHEMERRDRTDGYGFCKHCTYSAMVFEPLTKCCKCGKLTRYSQDYKQKYYCERHAQCKPKNPKPYSWDIRKRYPRKKKKLIKQGVSFQIYGTVYGKVTARGNHIIRFEGNGKYIAPIFKNSIQKLIMIGKRKRR